MTHFMIVFQIDEEPVAALWESAHLSPKSLKIKAHKPPSHTTTPDAKTTVMSKAYHPKVADPQVLPCSS